MKKTYKIKVNGKAYKVEVESVEEIASAPAAAPKEAQKEEQPKVAMPAPAAAGANDVLSPIQGSVIKVLVKVGDKVKKGQPLFVIEAMKLENEVPSPAEGEIAEILVGKGQSVASKEILCRIK